MKTQIPTTAEVRQMLEPLSHAPMQQLSRLSGVPFTTLQKIKDGTTKSAKLDTVRQFLPHIAAAKRYAERRAAFLAPLPPARPVPGRVVEAPAPTNAA